MSNNIKKSKDRQRMVKGITLVSMLMILSLAAIACNRTGNTNTSDKNITDEIEPTAEPTPTQGKESDEGLAPTQGAETTGGLEPTQVPEPTEVLTPTPGQNDPKPTEKPAPTKKPDSASDTEFFREFNPSDRVYHGTTAFVQGDFLFYKSGKLTSSVIASENLKTSKVKEITTIDDTFFNSSEFYLKGSDIYYHADGNIYRVGIDGKNKTRIFKGKATILGIHEDNVYALDRKTKEIISINKAGEKKALVKLNSIDPLEVVMVENGFYFINKRSNNTLNGNDPMDRLYYIGMDGKGKTEIYASLDIFDLKKSGNDVFFLAITDSPEAMELRKANGHKTALLYSTSKEELTALGCNWLDRNSFTLLGVSRTHVYYGVNFNNGKDLNIYSVETDGDNHGLFRNAYDIKGVRQDAYFRSGDVDEGYLKIIFDCDEAPVEVYLINLQDDTVIKFDGGYYLPGSIDVEGDNVYYLKSSEYDRYTENPKLYQYGRSKLSELK